MCCVKIKHSRMRGDDDTLVEDFFFDRWSFLTSNVDASRAYESLAFASVKNIGAISSSQS